jgi:hypothetical protein
MTQDTRKYPKIERHFIPAIIAPIEGSYNHQPPVSRRDHKAVSRRIRSQVRPFAPAADIPSETKEKFVSPAANMRKIIDFSMASLHESDKRWHCSVMAEMCERLASCWNCTNKITPEQLYVLYEIHAWACPKTGTKHSIRTPLSIEFLTHVWQGGKLEISNVRPVYNGFLPGQYRWVQPTYIEAIAA